MSFYLLVSTILNMLYRALYFFLFPCISLWGTDTFSTGPIPEWVKPCPFTLDAPLQTSHIHVQDLLFERQINWEEETTYTHEVSKVIAPVGIEHLSELRFNYNPAHQRLVLHTLRLYRDGEWIDRLNSTRHQLLQREASLEEKIYSGHLTMVYFLSDIREGDILEYAFSCLGNDPLLHPYHEALLYLQPSVPVEKIYYRIVLNPAHRAFFKPFCTEQFPSVREPGEWVWEINRPKAYEKEPGVPYWYDPLERVQVTQFSHWKEVISHLLPFYSQNINLGEEALALVQQWQEMNQDKTAQALLAIRFVQDHVRYFGFEEGTSAGKPSPAQETFRRRSGDCKDKTVLLQALLQMMGIISHPVLVAADAKDANTWLPNLTLFNHVVLQIEIEGKFFYVDPTCILQGGSLQDNYFPDYEWGLVIAEETEGLTPLPKYSLPRPTTISTLVRLISPLSADVTTSITFYGMKAETRRRELHHLGHKKFAEGYSQEIPRKGKLLSPPEMIDDRESNVFTLTLLYQLPTTSRSHTKTLPLHSYLLNMSFHDDLTPGRQAPYALSYPLWVKEHIYVENPFNSWGFERDEMCEETGAFFYKFSLQKQAKMAELDFEIHHFQDHLAGEEVHSYFTMAQKIERPEPLVIFSSSSESSATRGPTLKR